jgi:protein SCO1/2
VRRAARAAAAAALLVGLVAAAAWWVRASSRPAPAMDGTLERLGVYGTVPAFSLTERSGRPVRRDDLRGSVWVANFVYTRCTDTCPLQSEQLRRIQTAFSGAPDLRLVSITVDPEHDTPAALRGYAGRYGAGERWWFLTGDKRAIYCLARDGFHLAVTDPGAAVPPPCEATAWLERLGPAAAWASHGSGGLVMHSDRLVLVDRAARIRAYHPASEPEASSRLMENLRRLLAERA